MAISKKAVNKFINRVHFLDDFIDLKKCSRVELEEMVDDLDPKPQFEKRLRDHQLVSFLIGASIPNFCFFLFAGGGKTALNLNLIKYHIESGRMKRALVLVPSDTIFSTWEKQSTLFTPSLKVEGLRGSTKQRLDRLEKTDADVVVLNYQGLLYLTTEKQKQRKKSKQVLSPEKIKYISSFFDCIILDESHNLKNHQSTIYKICNAISANMKYRYALTGTPFSDPHDLWSQFHVVDRGATLGKTLSIFRQAFFNESQNYWGGFEYKFKKDMKETLNKMIRHRSITYEDTECLDLPDTIYDKVYLDLPSGAKKYYEKFVAEFKEQVKSRIQEKQNTFLKMRTVASGFVGLTVEDTGKISVKLPNNPKLEWLVTYLNGLPNNEKVVVFHDFIYTSSLIQEELKKKKIKFAVLNGTIKDKDKEINKFLSDKEVQVFIVNSAAGGTGLDGLQEVCHRVVYYEAPLSPITRQQSVMRIRRDGSKSNHVYITDLVVKGTVEDKILYSLAAGKNLFDELMGGKVKV